MHFYLTIKLRLSIGIGRPVVGVLAAVGYAGVGTVSWLWPYSIRPRDLWPGNLTWPDLVIEHWMAVDSDPRLYLAQPNKTADPITSDLAILFKLCAVLLLLALCSCCVECETAVRDVVSRGWHCAVCYYWCHLSILIIISILLSSPVDSSLLWCAQYC